jgi:tRNA uridine 5-carboxymethylaminomethyl modification enzyme
VDEPYRLFTSRAEFRLLLRQDNALRRLFPVAMGLGILNEEELELGSRALEAEDAVFRLSQDTAISPDLANPLLMEAGATTIEEPVRLAELARRPGMRLEALLDAVGAPPRGESAGWAAIELRYQGYIARERDAAERLSQLDAFVLPGDLEFAGFLSLSHEAREKLARLRPLSLGAAGRIPGVSPSDLQNLVVEVLKRRQSVCPENS